MVTKTIYTDPYQVVIDIGPVPPAEEWLQETTYLIDKSGHTTAIIAQTDQPTAGVSLQPVPFTPANAQVALVASPTATPSPAPTPSPGQSGNPNTVITLAAAGVVFGVVIIAVTLYLLRRRALKQRLRAERSPLFSEDSATSGSTTSSNSSEKIFHELKTPEGVEPALRMGEVLPSWEAFLEEVEREYGNVDKKSTSADSKSRTDGVSRRANTAELKERYDRLLARHRIIRANVGFGPNTWGGLPATTRKVTTFSTRQTEEEFPAVAQPISILKRPGGSTRKGVRVPDAIHGMLGLGDGKEWKMNIDETEVKKTVTFGSAEVREFGRTPSASSAGSMLSRDDAIM